MKLFIIYAGLEDAHQVWPDQRSLPLQRVAGSNVLGHVLSQMREILTAELFVVVDRDQEAVAAWIADNIPAVQAKVITTASGSTPLHALAACRQYFGRGPLLVALGSTITEADYKALEQSAAPVTLLTQPPLESAPALPAAQDETSRPWAGVCYFRQGVDLLVALDRAQAPDATLSALLNDLLSEKRPATMCLDTRTTQDLLFANARLLGLGFGSENAIERSYVEDFTVIPPVFLHETAVIENAVIGPFANVEAGARISSSVVRNSLIGQEAAVENAVLDGALVGAQAQVKTSGHALFVKDNGQIAL